MPKIFLTCCSILALTTACVPELKVQEVYAPLTGDIIRSIIGPTDEGGGVRISGIQTLGRRDYTQTRSTSSCGVGSSTRTIKRRLCDGRVVTRQIKVGGSQPATMVQSGYVVQDSQFFPGVGMAQTAVNATIGAVGFAGGMYAGRPPASNFSISQQSGDNTSSNYSTSAGSTASAKGGNSTGGNATGGSATSTSAGGQGGQANATSKGGAGGSGGAGGTGGMGGTGGNGLGIGGSAVTSSNSNASTTNTKTLNRQSHEFHVQNPHIPNEKPSHKKVYEDKKTYKHEDKKH